MSLSTHIESKAICCHAGKPGKRPCAKSDLSLRTSPACLHSHPPPATRGCHPPPETLSQPYTQYSILDTLVFHFCTFARGEAAFAPLHGISASHVPMPPCQHVPSRLRRALVNVSTCQHVPSRKRMSPCHHAHMSPRDLWSRSGKFWFSDPMVRPDPVFGLRCGQANLSDTASAIGCQA